jgi:hypothetical protein
LISPLDGLATVERVFLCALGEVRVLARRAMTGVKDFVLVLADMLALMKLRIRRAIK